MECNIFVNIIYIDFFCHFVLRYFWLYTFIMSLYDEDCLSNNLCGVLHPQILKATSESNPIYLKLNVEMYSTL